MILIKRMLLGAFFVVIAVGSAHAATISGVELQQDAEGSAVLISEDKGTNYEVFDLSDRTPARVILLFPGTKLASSVEPVKATGADDISTVFPEQTADGVKVEISMQHKRAYKVVEQGNNLLVRFTNPAATAGKAMMQATKDEMVVAPRGAISTAQASKFAVGLKASTLGAGAEIAIGLSPHVNLRGVVNGFERSSRGWSNAILFNGKLNMFTAGAILDFMPAAHGDFHLSLGGLYDGNKLKLTATPTGSNFVINGVTYTAAQVGTLTGSVKFNPFAPYVGLGYGNAIADSGWSASFDAGAIYQGTAKVALTATGTAAGLAANVAAEQATIQHAARNYKWWPVVSLSLDYGF